jgi:hypothetical protein
MRTVLLYILAVTVVVMVAFGVRDAVSFGIGVSGGASRAPRDLWNALGDAVSWGLEYKEGAAAILIICVTLLFIGKDPKIKHR